MCSVCSMWSRLRFRASGLWPSFGRAWLRLWVSELGLGMREGCGTAAPLLPMLLCAQGGPAAGQALLMRANGRLACVDSAHAQVEAAMAAIDAWAPQADPSLVRHMVVQVGGAWGPQGKGQGLADGFEYSDSEHALVHTIPRSQHFRSFALFEPKCHDASCFAGADLPGPALFPDLHSLAAGASGQGRAAQGERRLAAGQPECRATEGVCKHVLSDGRLWTSPCSRGCGQGGGKGRGDTPAGVQGDDDAAGTEEGLRQPAWLMAGLLGLRC